MTATTLWIEITIGGSLYLVAVGFLILAGFGIKDLRSLEAAKDYLPYLSACGVAASYIAGIVAHRLVQMLASPLLSRIERLLRITPLTERSDRNQVLTNMVKVWHSGSARLHRELDFQYALVALLRSLLLSVPFLGASISVWLVTAAPSRSWLPVLSVVLLWPLCFAAYRRQWMQYRTIRNAAISELN